MLLDISIYLYNACQFSKKSSKLPNNALLDPQSHPLFYIKNSIKASSYKGVNKYLSILVYNTLGLKSANHFSIVFPNKWYMKSVKVLEIREGYSFFAFSISLVNPFRAYFSGCIDVYVTNDGVIWEVDPRF